MTYTETGAEELRRIVRTLDDTVESVLDDYTAEELIKLVRACWSSKWDCYPDNLDQRQRAEAIRYGTAPDWSDEDFEQPIYRKGLHNA